MKPPGPPNPPQPQPVPTKSDNDLSAILKRSDQRVKDIFERHDPERRDPPPPERKQSGNP